MNNSDGFKRCIDWMAEECGIQKKANESDVSFVLRVYLRSLFYLFPGERGTRQRYEVQQHIRKGQMARLIWRTGGVKVKGVSIPKRRTVYKEDPNY